LRITDEHAARLARHGYTIVPGFLAGDELRAARDNMLRYVPTAEELAATPERYSWVFDEAEHLQTEFPFAGEALNHVSTHPEIIEFVSRLLGTERVLLSQAAIWAKYAGTGDFEQGLHLDYQGNTLVVPRDDGDYRQVNMILYYGDVELDMGPTYVVSQEKTKHLPMWPTHRTRKKDPQLYKDERPVLAQTGTLFIFSMRTWHRASNIEADSGARFSHHLVWRSSAHPFAGYHLWSRMGENPELQRFVERATPRQREVLGFPTPGDAYWNEETLAAVALRYPRMDLGPYRKQGGSKR
jgi:ectoine hydroxylase-related dioxygenase (phytanoyl-CoA dioxygenase family)